MSTAEQAESGAGLAAQETALLAEAVRRGWLVVDHLTDAGVSGKSLTGRPALARALQHVTSGSADALVVAKLDRLSRSLLDFAGVMARAQAEGWALVALDVDVDTTTPSGRLVANVMASVAEWERETIGARTRDSLAARRGKVLSWVVRAPSARTLLRGLANSVLLVFPSLPAQTTQHRGRPHGSRRSALVPVERAQGPDLSGARQHLTECGHVAPCSRSNAN